MTKAVVFTAKAFNAATVGLIDACKSVDATLASKSKTINKWASLSAAGIQSGALTFESVKESVIARFPKAETLADCGNTIKGQFYALQRIVKAGDAYIARLVAGEALNTVAKAAPAVQRQEKGKRASKPSKGKGKPRAITLETALEAVNSWLDAALAGDVEMARGLASNADLALVVAKCDKLGAVLQAPAKAETASAKAAKAAAATTRKAQAAARKAAKAAPKAPKARPLPKGKAKTTVRLLKAA